MTFFYFLLGLFGLAAIGLYKACIYSVRHPKYYVMLPRQ